MYALPANALLFLRALVFAEDYPRSCVAANRLFSVPRCVRTAAELNRLVHDRVNLRTVVSRDEKKKEKTKGTRHIVFKTLGLRTLNDLVSRQYSSI